MQLLRIAERETALDNLHRAIADAATQRHKAAEDKHNRETNVVSPSFTRGDHVLRALERVHKLCFK